MKVILLHTDLRLYWEPRLRALHEFASIAGWDFQVLEIAGHGSPYAFAGKTNDSDRQWWQVLYPERRMEEIPAKEAAGAVYKFLDRKKPDVVLAGAIAFPSGAAAVRWAYNRNKRVIIFDNARQADVQRSWFVDWIKRRIYGQVDAMLIPAPSHYPDYARFGFGEHNIFYGLNVIDNDYFSVCESKACVKSNSGSFSLPDRFLLFVGRQVPKKNCKGLLKAWKLFCQARPESDLALVMVGNGSEREYLLEYSKDLDRVYFHEFVEKAILREKFYPCAHGLILPSKYGETWGLVVNEAMAAARPVLVSTQCGCRETLVQEGINGWSFDPDDEGAMSLAIARLDALSDDEWFAMSRASAEIIAAWGIPRFIQGVKEAVDYVVGRAPRPARSLVDTAILNTWHGRYRPT